MFLGRFTEFFTLIVLSSVVSSCQLFQPGVSKYEVNRTAYKQADVSETRILVSVFDQQAWLLDGDDRVLVRTGVSTGTIDHPTPLGNFKVLEKLEQKKSNKYGKFVHARTGKVLVEKNWLHEGEPPEGSEFEGTEMPYWLRITWDGVGMHVGDFPRRTRCSFGCVRVHKSAQRRIYAKTRVGTPVTIVWDSKIAEMMKKM